MAGKLTQSVRKYLITGALISLPLVVTVYVLWFTLSFLDNAFGSLVGMVFGRRIPGAGMVLSVSLLLAVGMIGANVIGRRLIAFGERIVLTIPLVRTIYHSVKQVIEAFSLQGQGGSFRRVVVIEYPRPRSYAIGFVTNENVEGVSAEGSGGMAAVFVPTTPNPTSGFVLLLPHDELMEAHMTVEQAFKFVISGGIITSPPASKAAAVQGADGRARSTPSVG